MARKGTTIFRKIEPILKYISVGLGIAFLTIAIQSQLGNPKESAVFAYTPAAIVAQTSQKQLRSYAQSLTNQGHELLNQGKAQEALEIWSQAKLAYKKLADREGVTGSQINQSLALQALGQYRRACIVLLPVLKLDYQDNLLCKQPSETEQPNQEKIDALKRAFVGQETSELEIIGLRILGDALRVIGNLEESQAILKQSLIIAEQLQLDLDISANLLSLGNSERALYIIQKDLYYRTKSTNYRDVAIKKVEDSLDYYKEAAKQAANTSTSKTTLLQAQLNRLSSLLEYEKWLEKESKSDSPKIKEKLSQIRFLVQSQIDELLNEPSLFSNLPPIPTIYARLNFAQSLIQLPEEKVRYASIAIQHARDALQKAEELANKRAEAYAIGILGNLYEQTNELAQAQNLTEKAVYLAQSIQAEDITYQWQYQLGKIYESEGKIQEAIAAYDAAVKTLDLVRQNLLYINTNLLFSFDEKVAPVYRDLISLYLKEPSKAHLKKVLEVNQKFQLTELENFLQCGLLDSKSLAQVVNELDRSPAAIIYTVVLEKQNTVEIIVNLPNQKQTNLYHYSAPWNKVKENITALRNNIQQPNLRNLNADEKITPRYQELYKLLIAPVRSYLPKQGTLVFVLDSQLQNIPMALLQDENKRYLIEDYSIALTLGSQIRKPKKLVWQESRALIAGVKEGKSFASEFKPLINVEFELEQVDKNTVSNEKLVEKNFTKENFQRKVSFSSFEIVHLATHGQFSSNPDQTFILAYDEPINVRQIDRLLRSKTEASSNPIELLVLSACQTAKGDERGGLGMAGVAVQAGARSTLASLWSVSDRSTALFMKEFYQGLKAGATKAEAVRQAQLAFLKNPDNNPEYDGYKHPYYWAAFILAGNWL